VSNLLPAVLGRSLVCLSLESDAQDQKHVSLALELVALTCPGLRFLRLGSESFVGDEDLRFLGRLRVLEVLELGAPATNGLRELGSLTSLRALRVSASMCLDRLIFAGLPPRLEWLDVCTSRAAEVVLGWVPESLRRVCLAGSPARGLRTTVDMLFGSHNLKLVIGLTEDGNTVPRLGDQFTQTKFSTKF
jgi:hypothetical protein